ncbi:MAG: virulence RhuM family protein [Gammaproteobacteria bacterium]|nr:virulence RhuM family protein [Gammaproteobacteria bacterium]
MKQPCCSIFELRNKVDYEPKADHSQTFFKIVQNKMHWAAHGHTAAEIIAKRANANNPLMGLTSYAGKRLRRTDVSPLSQILTYCYTDGLNKLQNTMD